MNNRSDRSRCFGVILIVALGVLGFAGCVRVGAGAGYWHTGPDGETTAKKVGFDTAEYVPGATVPGKVTF
ncbi:MAG TPA: hypothetical protein PLL75_04900 [Candidatus Omnitrophota bacterium]|nr:hypothetical protein [Candidatus Omnitrophota bacterium]HPS37047.1 hypothetical protein [Candidatus Omnitrophota bacterium]